MTKYLYSSKAVSVKIEGCECESAQLFKTALTVSELNHVSDPENKEGKTAVLDVHHLVDESVKMADLWSILCMI